MKAWALVHVGEDIASQLKIVGYIIVSQTKPDATLIKGFNEKVVRIELKEIK